LLATRWAHGLYTRGKLVEDVRLRDLLATAETDHDVAIVTEVDEALEAVQQRVVVVVEIAVVDNAPSTPT